VLRNPVIAAAGCFPLPARPWTAAEVAPLGAVCTPSIAARTRPAGSGFGITEAPAGLLLRGGYPTVSPRRVRDEIGPRWQATGTPLIATVRATDPDECLSVVASLADGESIAALELSLVEPERHGSRAVEATAAPRLIDRVCRLWSGVVIVKISPGFAAGAELLGQLESAGAHAITLGGGFEAWSGGTAGAAHQPGPGRLVGPATGPLVLRQVTSLARASRLPVIASGGVPNATGVLELLAAGAVAVQVGSVALRSALAAVAIARAVEERLIERVARPQPSASV
jgi:dihydroorotate dehydrogenase (NAD+) catalytic subunit